MAQAIHDRGAAGVELIIGGRRIMPRAVTPVPGGIAAELQGEALLALLDANFHGSDSIEVLGGGALDRRPMDVAAIEMCGATTRVTLVCAGAAPRLN